MLIQIPPKYRKRGPKIQPGSAPTPPPPTLVTVVSVTPSDVDEQTTLWSFSSPVVSVVAVDALWLDGSACDQWEMTGDGKLLLRYFEVIEPGQMWEVVGDQPLSIQFASGQQIVVPESGSVEE